MSYNALDYLLIFLLVIGTFWGMMRGVIKLLIGIFSLYVGLVIALLLYQPLAGFFRDLMPSLSVTGSEAIAFAFLLIVCANVLDFLTRLLSTPPEQRQRRGRFPAEGDEDSRLRRFVIGLPAMLAGLVIGLVVTAVWMSLGLAVLQFLLKTGGPTLGGIARDLRDQLASSALINVFNYVLYLVYQSVSFWLPPHNTPPSIFFKIIRPI